jgi:hypothetical protein
MAREAPEFDAQCDIAALVNGKPDEPEPLLREFVHDLAIRGYRVVGLIQTRLRDGGAGVTVLPTGETIPLAQKLDALSNLYGGNSCDLSDAALPADGAEAVATTRRAVILRKAAAMIGAVVKKRNLTCSKLITVPSRHWKTPCMRKNCSPARLPGSQQYTATSS